MVAICCSASQRERATESVPPRACHLERSAPPSAAGVGCGWCSGAVIEQQAPARHAECTRDASRVHCSCSAKQRPPAQRKEPVPTRARLRQLERLSASAGSHPVGSQCLGSQAHRRREQLRATPRRAKATLSSVAAAARFRHAVGCGGGRGLRQPRSRPAGGLGGRSHAATTSAKRGVAPGHSRIWAKSVENVQKKRVSSLWQLRSLRALPGRTTCWICALPGSQGVHRSNRSE